MHRVGTILAALALLVGCGKEKAGHVQESAAVAPAESAASPALRGPAPSREAAMDVDIKTLLGEYKDNEVRADTRFKGKLIKVSGTAGDIKKDLTGDIYVTVGTGGMLEIPTVQCFVAKGQEGDAAALSKGQKVTVQGRVQGLMMNVLVEDCVINPMMKLCKRLQTALGAKRCMTDAKTGDASGISIDDDGKTGMGAVLMCLNGNEKMSAQAAYEKFPSLIEPSEVFIGSKTTQCFGVFSNDNGPVPADIKTKAQAFFDAL